MDDMLTASIEPVLEERCTPALVREMLGAGADNARRDLWQALDELGFLDALVPESAGGSGVSFDECAGVLFAFGRHAMPLPAAHTMIARRLLAAASMALPCGPIAFAVLDGSASNTAFVPFGLACESVLVEMSDGFRLIDIDDATVQPRTEWGGLDATVLFPAGAGKRVRTAHADDEPPMGVLLELGALVKAAAMVGAMARVLDMTITFVNDRQQFGRSIGKFQVVQHNLSVMAEHTSAAQIAVQSACASDSFSKARLSRGIAKARASRSAPLVANTAHALTGAMGITAEYDLQLFTRCLHSQRLQFGSESYWDEIVGSHVLEHWDSAVPEIIHMTS
ncbi:acyl-CoA dehydrogenase [Paraburkholderia sp. GAS448]|uniref:acyl-CoA dehydrogenase family protein n=1 Tax=Paraburkholderia sp. GAS448 TaxID=3035136 RepID=UPI003D1DA0E2